jgi:hypothetical protein
MSAVAEKADPKLWETVKAKVTRSSKGGKADQWSARKAQLAVHDYKEAGGTYKGEKSEDNHLAEWTDEEWGTKSGRESGETGERYLPKKAREALTSEEYRRTTRAKRAATAKGHQFSAQPKDVAEKTARYRTSGRADGPTKADLMAKARQKNVPGRSRMTKAQLAKAVA